MDRTEVIAIAKTPNGGATTKALEELEQSGFITSYLPFGMLKGNRKLSPNITL